MSSSTSRPRLVFTAIVLSAIALGFAALGQFQQSPFARVLMSDEESYTRWAQAILSGHGLPAAPLYQDPLYPYLLALWFALAGTAPQWVRALQAALGGVSVALAGLAAAQILGRRGGIIAAAILAGCASLYYFELQISKETLVIFLTALSLWLGARAVDGGGRRWLALGLVFGFMCLTRGNFLLVAPGVALWALLRGGDRLRAARQAAFFSAGLALVLLPVAAWNFHVSGEFALTTYSGGHNFYLGNNPDADGSYVIPAFAHGHPLQDPADFKAEAERNTGRSLTATQASRYWLGQGLDWLRQNPAAAGRLWARKLGLLLHQHEPPNLYSLDLLRDHFVSLLGLPFLGYGFLWGPALAGVFILRRRPGAQYLIVLTLLYALSLLPFFIVDRYRAPLLPALAVLAAAFIDWCPRAWRAGRRKKLAAALAAACALAAVGLRPLATPDATRASEAALAGYAYLHEGDPATAVGWYREARALAPDDENIWTGWAESVSALGRADLPLLLAQTRTDDPLDLFVAGKRLAQLGRYPEATRVFEQAVRLDPRYLRACLHLADLYSRPEMRDLPRAKSWAMRALELDPASAEAFDALDRVESAGGSGE